MKHILSCSGGKDSVACLIFCIEKDYQIDEVIFCDTGVEYPEIYENIEKIKNILNYKHIQFTIIKNDFFKLLKEHSYAKNHWPIFNVRWCSGIMKRDAVNHYLREKYGLHNYINICGIAVDEKKRCKKSKYFKYPLVEWGITEKQCLEKYLSCGFNKRIYEIFTRTGCWCCPFKKNDEIRKTIQYYPKLWAKLKEIDKTTTNKWRNKGCEYWERKVNND